MRVHEAPIHGTGRRVERCARWMSAAALGVLAAGPVRLLAAQPGAAEHHGGEANLVLPDLDAVRFLGIDGHTLLLGGLLICALGSLFGLIDLRAAEEPAGARVDARDLGADLRDLQDLPGARRASSCWCSRSSSP